jgi:hypothetical protein
VHFSYIYLDLGQSGIVKATIVLLMKFKDIAGARLVPPAGRWQGDAAMRKWERSFIRWRKHGEPAIMILGK